MSQTSPDNSLPGMTSSEFIAHAAAHGVDRTTALETYRHIFRHGAPDSREWQPADLPVRIPPVADSHEEHGTVKFLQRLEDSLEIESVLIPGEGTTGRQRTTLCVSSQVGCALNCTFCETAQMGLMRNLSVDEIVAQWWNSRFALRADVTNIVFMGMGEPMDNIDAVIAAIRVFTDQNGPAVAPSRITVSTVGRVEGIDQLAALAREPGFGRINLAVSINAPNDAIRSEIMPINRATPMRDLMEAMQRWPLNDRSRILIEYVIIPGVNDRLEHADELCDYLEPLNCTVNVIPYNPRRHSPWPAPEPEAVRQFGEQIAARGQLVRTRQTKGRSVMAACGQLGSEKIRKRQYVGGGGLPLTP